jgi:hypothetical protein
MPARFYPEYPVFQSPAEEKVFETLLTELSNSSEIFCNYMFFDGNITREIDFIVLSPGHGVILIEVKGGQVVLNADGNFENAKGEIDPHKQITEGMYKLRDVIAERWSQHHKPRLAWVIAFPDATMSDDIYTHSVPRTRILDQTEIADIGSKIRRIMHDTENIVNSGEDLEAISLILRNVRDDSGIYQDQWATIENYREALSVSQSTILASLRYLPNYILTGPAGSGKTFLALEQARRHVEQGRSVALLCYNFGLAKFLKSETDRWPLNLRPNYVGTFHSFLQNVWKVSTPNNASTEWWEETSAKEALKNLQKNKSLEKFDAFVVDEAQDFNDQWWTALTMGFKDPSADTFVSAFGDIDQKIFRDQDSNHFDFPRIALDGNLRSADPIIEVASKLMGFEIEGRGIKGPPVRFVQCETANANGAADDVVDELLNDGVPHSKLMLLTTNRRHEMQMMLAANGKDHYWDEFHSEDEIFYSHVSSFKGLERSGVIVAIDGWKDPKKAREALYVAITRARDKLVIVGDPADIEIQFGKAFADFLRTKIDG